MNAKPVLRTVFVVEAWLVNGLIGLVCWLVPGWFAGQFASGLPPVTLEFVRWYGVLLLVLAVVMLRALATRDDKVAKPAVEALLVGDLAHLGASVFWFAQIGLVNLGTILMVVLSMALAAARIAWLVIDHREKGAAPSWNL